LHVKRDVREQTALQFIFTAEHPSPASPPTASTGDHGDLQERRIRRSAGKPVVPASRVFVMAQKFGGGMIQASSFNESVQKHKQSTARHWWDMKPITVQTSLAKQNYYL